MGLSSSEEGRLKSRLPPEREYSPWGKSVLGLATPPRAVRVRRNTRSTPPLASGCGEPAVCFFDRQVTFVVDPGSKVHMLSPPPGSPVGGPGRHRPLFPSIPRETTP